MHGEEDDEDKGWARGSAGGAHFTRAHALLHPCPLPLPLSPSLLRNEPGRVPADPQAAAIRHVPCRRPPLHSFPSSPLRSLVPGGGQLGGEPSMSGGFPARLAPSSDSMSPGTNMHSDTSVPLFLFLFPFFLFLLSAPAEKQHAQLLGPRCFGCALGCVRSGHLALRAQTGRRRDAQDVVGVALWAWEPLQGVIFLFFYALASIGFPRPRASPQCGAGVRARRAGKTRAGACANSPLYRRHRTRAGGGKGISTLWRSRAAWLRTSPPLISTY